VAIAEEVVPERRRMEKRLQDGVHEAGVAHVVQAPQSPREKILVIGSRAVRRGLI
jgi:hypothetical protein